MAEKYYAASSEDPLASPALPQKQAAVATPDMVGQHPALLAAQSHHPFRIPLASQKTDLPLARV